jgi:hypothetical protein
MDDKSLSLRHSPTMYHTWGAALRGAPQEKPETITRCGVTFFPHRMQLSEDFVATTFWALVCQVRGSQVAAAFYQSFWFRQALEIVTRMAF